MRIPIPLAASLFLLATAVHALTPGVTSCGTVINVPGQYTLANDLIDCPANGVTIDANNVVLLLGGHVIDGVGGGTGVSVRPGRSRVTIRGSGTITGFTVGVGFVDTDYSIVHNLTIDGNQFGIGVNVNPVNNSPSEYNRFVGNVIVNNTGHGITLNGGNYSNISANDASHNGFRGIYLYRGVGNSVRDNAANDNGEVGISIGATSTGHSVTQNTALGNIAADLLDENADCATNHWWDNTFGTAYPATCID